MIVLCPFVQASKTNQLTADYPGTPGWDDNAATFELIISSNNLHGDFQLANGYGHVKAEEVFKVSCFWSQFIIRS